MSEALAPAAPPTSRALATGVLVVVNPHAARAESGNVRQALEDALRQRGLRHDLFETQAGPEARLAADRAVRSALQDGCRRFVVAGGDGTVAMVASSLVRAHQSRPTLLLGIVPVGTANILARDLGLPLAIPAAIELALDGDHGLELDAMMSGDRPIFTQVGVGLDAQMIQHTSRPDQIKHGRFAYIASFLRRAILHRPGRYELEIDGEIHRFRAWQIVVANIGTLGASPFSWGPGIDPADGILDVCVYRARSARDYLTLIPRLLTGRHHHGAHTQFFQARTRVVIRGRGSTLVQGDGEILGRIPVTLDLLPRAVRICVPRPVPTPDAVTGAEGENLMTPLPPQASAKPAEPAEETIKGEVESMVAQRSRTWVLQGWWSHPFTFIAALDAALFLRINTLPLGTVVDRVLLTLSSVMHYGEGWAIVAALMLIRDFSGGLRASLEALPVLWVTMLIVNFPLKRLFRRTRPFRSYVHARVVGPEPKDFSFPSGHTAAAFAGALLFSAHVPQAAPLFYALAIVVGFSRVYLGVHYPSDVVVGAGVGSALAALLGVLLRWMLAIFS